MSDAEQKRRLVDEMIRSRIESSGETEAEAIQKILAQISDLPDDTSMMVDQSGEVVDARTIRVWASFYRTPETKQ
jgi:polyhydroxyalkanoate synthesis regulator phasin